MAALTIDHQPPATVDKLTTDTEGRFLRAATTWNGLFIAMAGPVIRVRAAVEGWASNAIVVGDFHSNEVLPFGLGKPKTWDVGRLVLRGPDTRP